jgi:hypothetical protein
MDRGTEARAGRPSVVKGTEGGDDEGILRVDFGPKERRLEEVSREEFFQTFEDRKLAFLQQDKTADGKDSRFSTSVRR